MQNTANAEVHVPGVPGTLLALCLIGVLSGCASTDPCQGTEGDVMDEAFAPLDDAVGDINRKINDEGPDGDCQLDQTSGTE